ncbi:MAG: FAD-binding oxidoreductase [Gemmatimonadetes bacterium]|nr:FAD-binding oxidoreductase [Gemmatimonadota bacterium]
MATAHIVELEGRREWENYHRTGTSHLKKRYGLRSGDGGRGRDDIAQAASEVQKWLLAAKEEGVPVRPVGGAWSLSNIQLVQNGWMLNTRRFNRCFRLAGHDFARPGSVDPGAFMLIEGGVQVDEVNDKLQEIERSLVTTGASNGQTFPGACATGTHGSVLTAGGIQQHVRAVQIVTPGGIYWIEPSAGLMSDDFIRETGSAPVRDDDAFAAALVAVGSLGIVTAMVIESVPRYLVRPWLKLIDFARDDVETLERGDFRAFSEKHGLKGHDPYFVMVITTPYRPWGGKAVARILYQFPYHSRYEHVEPGKLGAGYDAQSMMAWALRQFPWARGQILQLIMRLGVGKGITEERYGTWGETLESSRPTADSFSAALFCDRARLVHTLEALCTAFSRAGGSTAVTLRFVKGGYGLLSPARWENSVAIDCDGPGGEGTLRAYRKMLDALERQGIEHTLHWGKINNLTPARVAANYGDDLSRWRAVRDRLLPDPADRRLFATEELRAFGLAD